MEKSPDAFRTISEVADWLETPAHVLRFWESRFSQVKPVKRAGGRRYYRPSDMALLGGIKKLLHDDGMTIRGVQKLLREQGVKHVASLSPEIDGVAPIESPAIDSIDVAIPSAPMAEDVPSLPDPVDDEPRVVPFAPISQSTPPIRTEAVPPTPVETPEDIVTPPLMDTQALEASVEETPDAQPTAPADSIEEPHNIEETAGPPPVTESFNFDAVETPPEPETFGEVDASPVVEDVSGADEEGVEELGDVSNVFASSQQTYPEDTFGLTEAEATHNEPTTPSVNAVDVPADPEDRDADFTAIGVLGRYSATDYARIPASELSALVARAEALHARLNG
ncbi:MerR family transcriptional regulator [Celeribacter arenosi]|uniref:HTH merR-type domain-containing protein n=1 Tax=Celeribacter arenosi TaxID=792649 RepID=A0ABP7KEY0_9RHOB